MNKTNESSMKLFQVGGARANYVLIICSLLWMVNFIDRQVLSVVLEPLKNHLNLTDGQAGLATSLLFFSMAIFAMPIAYLSDRWGRKEMIAGMAIFWSGAVFLTGLADNFYTVALARFLTGIGIAGFSSAAMALISASFPENVRAKKFGIFNMFQAMGILLSLVVGGYLSVNFGGWKSPFFMFAVPGILLGILALFMQDYSSDNQGTDNSGNFLVQIKRLLVIPTLRWLYLGYTLVIIITFSVLSWTPALIIRKFSVDEGMAGIIMAAAGAFTLPGAIFGGYVADAWQSRHPAGRLRFAGVMSLASTVSIIAAIVSVFYLATHTSFSNPWIVTGAIMISLFCMVNASITPAVMAVTQSVAPKKLRSLVWGLCLFVIMVAGGAWSPAFTGYLSDLLGGESLGLAKALMIVSLSGILGFISLWKGSGTYHDDSKKVEMQ